MGQPLLGPLDRLMSALEKLPGIGRRSAERLAFHLLKQPTEEALVLARAIEDVKQQIRHCSVCYNLTEDDPCDICRNPQRDDAEVVVVEQPKDLMALEATGLIKGKYHVLLGHIAPLDGVEPGDLTLDALLTRVQSGTIREVVLATNPTMEGDGTALHIHSLLQDADVRVTRLARGLAVGSQVEYASRAMLESAILGRTPL
jgi:recombination protein RecR